MDNQAFSLIQINDPLEWETLVLRSLRYTFLQAWQFGLVQETLERKVFHYTWQKNGEVYVLAQILLINSRRGRILQLRHAPLLMPVVQQLAKTELQQLWQQISSDLLTLKQNEQVDFIRVQTLLKPEETDIDWYQYLQTQGARPANIHNIDAEKTLVLDISKTDEELQQNFRKQTRYYVRHAAKDGVTIEIWRQTAAQQWQAMNSEAEAAAATNTLATFDPVAEFYKIHHDTIIRQKFISYDLEYYENYLRCLNSIEGSQLHAEVYLARFEGKYIAGAIILYYGQAAYYSDGGSLTEYAKIPASYLIQWTAIQRAKSLGCTSYNFWGGVSPDKENKNYPWYGIDLFKRGFGGERVEYWHMHDWGTNLLYRLARVWEYWEKFKRGY